MSRVETNLTDAEWEAKFNGPRQALLERLFGKTPCPVSDLSPVVRVVDKNFGTGKSFMDQDYVRITHPMNANTDGLEQYTAQIQRNGGRLVVKMTASKLDELKEVPAPVK